MAYIAGTLCTEEVNECDPDPCNHGATCVDGVNKYTCICTPGYQGKCDLDLDKFYLCAWGQQVHMYLYPWIARSVWSWSW